MPVPRCFDVSRFVSDVRDENFLFSCCLNACDRYYSFGFFKNILYFLMSFGSFVVPDFPV